MKGKPIIILAVILFLFAPLAFSQSRDTGAISGKVLDDQNNPLPGATVTLTSEKIMGPRTQISDASGLYRFQALPPGLYAVKAELKGFQPMIREDIRLTTTITLTLDLTLKQATVEEQVTVTAVSPTVDIKSTETASITLSNEVLRNIPYSQFTSDIVNMSPAVSSNEAYGASVSRGISWQMDGVGVGDTDGGTAWVFLDHNIIEEAKVMGVGLPAEYGAFTGVIFNLVTKQGGNRFSGQIEADYQGRMVQPGETNAPFPAGSFWGTENNSAYVNDFPSITSANQSMSDLNFQLGGPIVKDKLWFYTGLQYYQQFVYPAGFATDDHYTEPRAFFKLTSQITPSLNATAYVEWDNYNRTYRSSNYATHPPEATVKQADPNLILNLSMIWILSPKTFIDFKAAGFTGYYDENPRTGRQTAQHYFDNDDPNLPPGVPNGGYYHYSAGFYAEHDRSRVQTNASLTHYAEDFIKGSHDFKFGVEVEHGYSRNKYGYTGPGGMYYEDYWGQVYSYTAYAYYNSGGHYLATQYLGYNTKTAYTRLEAFVQDSWQITSRLNINLGLRLSQNWGQVIGQSGSPYSALSLAPRIGFTFDILGDKTTILKAHWGQYTDGMYASILDRLGTNFADKVFYQWDPAPNMQEYVEYARDVHGVWSIADGIKHPYMEQWTAGIERELFKDASFSLTFIQRSYHNFIGAYNANAVWAPKSVVVPAPINKTFTVYNIVGGQDDPNWIITNLEDMTNIYQSTLGFTTNPYRNYWGLEFVFNKRFSNRWQLMASYVYSVAKGTIDNSSAYTDIGWHPAGYDPNYWINADGHVGYDNTHLIKLQATYALPFGINLSAYFHSSTNGTWQVQFRTKSFNQGHVTFLAEPRGSEHYPMDKTLDLRLEKTFTIGGKYQLGVIFDVFNLFNDNTFTSWGTRLNYDYFPLALTDSQGVPAYGVSTDGHRLLGLVYPRRARLGIRLIF